MKTQLYAAFELFVRRHTSVDNLEEESENDCTTVKDAHRVSCNMNDFQMNIG